MAAAPVPLYPATSTRGLVPGARRGNSVAGNNGRLQSKASSSSVSGFNVNLANASAAAAAAAATGRTQAAATRTQTTSARTQAAATTVLLTSAAVDRAHAADIVTRTQAASARCRAAGARIQAAEAQTRGMESRNRAASSRYGEAPRPSLKAKYRARKGEEDDGIECVEEVGIEEQIRRRMATSAVINLADSDGWTSMPYSPANAKSPQAKKKMKLGSDEMKAGRTGGSGGHRVVDLT